MLYVIICCKIKLKVKMDSSLKTALKITFVLIFLGMTSFLVTIIFEKPKDLTTKPPTVFKALTPSPTVTPTPEQKVIYKKEYIPEVTPEPNWTPEQYMSDAERQAYIERRTQELLREYQSDISVFDFPQPTPILLTPDPVDYCDLVNCVPVVPKVVPNVPAGP